MKTPFNVGGAMVTTEDVDGDGTLDLVTRFAAPFPRLDVLPDRHRKHREPGHAGPRAGLQRPALIAGADATTTLPPAGSESVALDLTARNGAGGPTTRTTDLGTMTADLTVLGRMKTDTSRRWRSAISTATCADDLVIGAPDADDTRALGAVGAVYVVFGGAPPGTTIDLSNAKSGQEMHFYGLNGGDHLGSAVACADLNNDGYGDLVVGAPGGTDGAGNVYAVFGGANFANNKTST